jgi:hypothetical protein
MLACFVLWQWYTRKKFEKHCSAVQKSWTVHCLPACLPALYACHVHSTARRQITLQHPTALHLKMFCFLPFSFAWTFLSFWELQSAPYSLHLQSEDSTQYDITSGVECDSDSTVIHTLDIKVHRAFCAHVFIVKFLHLFTY